MRAREEYDDMTEDEYESYRRDEAEEREARAERDDHAEEPWEPR